MFSKFLRLPRRSLTFQTIRYLQTITPKTSQIRSTTTSTTPSSTPPPVSPTAAFIERIRHRFKVKVPEPPLALQELSVFWKFRQKRYAETIKGRGDPWKLSELLFTAVRRKHPVRLALRFFIYHLLLAIPLLWVHPELLPAAVLCGDWRENSIDSTTMVDSVSGMLYPPPEWVTHLVHVWEQPAVLHSFSNVSSLFAGGQYHNNNIIII